MGKKRLQTRQVRQVRQMRQVKPKNLPAPTTTGDQRKQREQYVKAGGLLQGYAPELVLKIGYVAGAAALACLAVMALVLLFLPYGWPVRIVAAVVWVMPVAFGLSFILPGFRLARKDLKSEPRLVQGQLLGASEASTSIGLGMLMVKTRGGVEQYLVAPDKMTKVPGNQVNVVLTVTPNLRHTRGVGVMGQRMMPRPQQPIPEAVQRMRLLPIATPAALVVAAIVGDDAVALVPMSSALPPITDDVVHAGLAFVVGAVLGGAVYGVSRVLQTRLTKQLQSLVPGGLR